MTMTGRIGLFPFALLVGAPVASCIAVNSGLGQATQGCPEFDANADAGANVNADVRSFMDASLDLRTVVAAVRPAVKTACAGIAADLGATDTWTALGDVDDAITNGNGTGACDAARRAIVAMMTAHQDAGFALVISRGACSPDFKEEADCEGGCSAKAKCDPGTVETRCDPAQLSVVCDDKCAAQGFCEGTMTTEANCEGQCEAECTGSCAGTCIDENGHRTDNDANCHGKCTAHCSGTCNGRCQIDSSAGVQCGTNVYCKGSCTTTHSSARCESEFTPPQCTIDESCFESCRAHAVAHAVCDPPTVKLLADASVSADVSLLVATINKNLPPLIQIAEAQGRIAVDILHDVGTSGQAVLNEGGNLDGKSLACATTAANSLSQTSTTLTVVTQASSQTTTDCTSHAQ